MILIVVPGPDFAVVLKNSLSSGRRSGAWASVGIAMSNSVQGLVAVVGLGALIAASQPLFTAIKWAGVAYLAYLGGQALRSAWIDAKPRLEERQVRSMIAEVREATIRSEQLISSLLALARADQSDFDRRAVDLAELARGEIAEASSRHPEIRFENELQPVVVQGDLVLLRELVGNLIDNAALHNRPGGFVSTTTRTSGAGAALTVENTGPVIEPSAVDKLFEPFQRGTTDRVAGTSGSGLGLSIVRAVARRHDADVHTTARPDGGLTVTVSMTQVRGDD